MAIFLNPALIQLLYLLIIIINNFLSRSGKYLLQRSGCIRAVIVKNKNGNYQDCGNYRPIEIATIISKLFEQVILINIKNFLDTTDNQFGFKTKHSTDMCVFLLKQAISYYITRSSPIFCVFLDASKAFDRVNHYLLFQKLIVRNVPMCFVRLLVFWCTQQSMQISGVDVIFRYFR